MASMKPLSPPSSSGPSTQQPGTASPWPANKSSISTTKKAEAATQIFRTKSSAAERVEDRPYPLCIKIAHHTDLPPSALPQVTTFMGDSKTKLPTALYILVAQRKRADRRSRKLLSSHEGQSSSSQFGPAPHSQILVVSEPSLRIACIGIVRCQGRRQA